MESTSTFKVYNASAGSGKTFTLVKNYLEILVSSPSEYAFQNILAITFTNKAAAEMKERILENLRSFSIGQQNDMFLVLSKETGLPPNKLIIKSKRILNNILQNYSAFNITTIDSFTHKLIRTFAYDLELPLNFEVEMDQGKLLNEAVDVLISKIGGNKALTDVLIEFSLQKINEDKAWDISKELNSIAKILLNEDDQKFLQNLQLKDLDDFKKIETQLKKEKRKIEEIFQKNGEEALELIDNAGIEHKSFVYTGELPKHLIKISTLSDQNYDSIKFDGRLEKNMNNTVFYSKNASRDIQNGIDEISEELTINYEVGKNLYHKHHGDYVLIDMVLKNIIPLAVLNNIQKELNEIKKHNSICLSAEFNQLISEKIKDEPAPYIYERIGEKFRYYFIDEMQDTSSLQWQNLIPLISNALSQEKSGLLLVGDAKQAIYRWRGGKAEQFIDLSLDEKGDNHNPFYLKKEIENLPVNYRSYSEIINFNNRFFTHIAPFLLNSTYRNLYEIGNKQELNKNTGGYIQLDFIDKSDLEKEEKELAYPKKILEIIQNLDPNFKRNDVCVLVRKKKDGIAVANYLSENGVEIISSETLLLKNSNKVTFIIDTLTYIQNPLNKNSKFKILAFLKDFLNINKKSHNFYEEFLNEEPLSFFEKLENYGIKFSLENFLQLPFYESIEKIIRSFNLLSTTDAYVQFFLDFILDYQRKNYNDLVGFLEHWEQKKENLSISSGEDETAIRIMTIHKSKGLEFPIVIFPCEIDINYEKDPTVWLDNLDVSLFNNLNNSLISCSKKITFTGNKGTKLYEKRKEALALDNYNLLYVALTRAIEQLYIISDYNVDKKGNEKTNLFSGMLINLLKNLETEKSWNETKLNYVFGNKTRVLPIKKEKIDLSTEVQKQFISTPWDSHDIKIVANSSKNWDTNQEAAVKYGLLIHEILSKIIVETDIENVLNSYVNSGIVSKEESPEIKSILKSIVLNPTLNSYFTDEYTVYTEREILNDTKSILIPDRLMIKEKTVIIIDYKTGASSISHKEQIESYENVLAKMGYSVLKKIIIYIDNNLSIIDF